MGQAERVLGPDKVRAADRAVEQASAGEDGLLPAVVDDKGEVGVGVARGGDGFDRQRTDPDGLPVRDRLPLEVNRVRGVHEVARAVRPGQFEPAGEVVVVDVGLGDVGDGDAGVAGGCLDAVRVPLRVDDQRHGAVMDEVAAVPELGGLDDDDVHD